MFSCTMGCPVGATISYLVMQFIEERAVSTAAHPPRWCYLCVDDNHTSLREDYLEEIHYHLKVLSI